MWLRPQELHLLRPLKRHTAGCRDEIHRPLRLQIHEALHRHHRISQEGRHQEDGGGFQEEIVRIFVENYSLFVGINVYLRQNIVRIFVDFGRIFVRIFVV